MTYIKLYPPIDSTTVNKFHIFEKNSLKEKVFSLLVSNQYLFLLSPNVAYKALADYLEEDLGLIKKELNELELEMSKNILIQ